MLNHVAIDGFCDQTAGGEDDGVVGDNPVVGMLNHVAIDGFCDQAAGREDEGVGGGNGW
jgi:hypothetical protein